MELNQLRGFLGIVSEGSFTKAAEKLYLTQPALSLQIKALEDELGEQLFERRNRRVFLTDAGAIFREKAELILGLVAEIYEEIEEQKGLQTGQVHIGTSDTLCLYLLPPVVSAFRDAYPGIDIHLTNRMSNEVVMLLKQGVIDFGLIALPVNDPQVITTHLCMQKDLAILPPDHPFAEQTSLGLADLSAETLLLLEDGSASRAALDDRFARAQFTPSVLELGSIEVIKRYVEIGLGISIVPAMSVDDEARSKRLATATLPWLAPRSVGTVQRAKGRMSRASEAFLQYVTVHLATNDSSDVTRI